MFKIKSPLTLFFGTVIVMALLALFCPEEKSLGVRIVYLHGVGVLLTFDIRVFKLSE